MAREHARDYQEMLRRLKKARERARLTQEDVARIFGRPQSFISKIESGERRLDPIELQRFSELYECEITDLVAARTLPDSTRSAAEQEEFFEGTLRPVRTRRDPQH